MRGRKKEPEGKRVTVCAKLSEAEAVEVDAARRGMSRSEYLREAALHAARIRPLPETDSSADV